MRDQTVINRFVAEALAQDSGEPAAGVAIVLACFTQSQPVQRQAGRAAVLGAYTAHHPRVARSDEAGARAHAATDLGSLHSEGFRQVPGNDQSNVALGRATADSGSTVVLHFTAAEER